MGSEEADHLETMLRHVQGSGDPFDRRTPLAHFTASALVVTSALDQVLLLHHRKLDRWLQCGGHVEPGDASPAEAALREAREETGLQDLGWHPLWTGLLDVDVHRIPDDPDVGAHDHLDLRYLVVADPREALQRSTSETNAIKWCTWAEAAALVDDAGLERLFDKVRRIQAHMDAL